ncbi:glutamate--cysteine ligase catalytic subunit [Clonorchis sinensis]|uniref:Glutamate--cysteine ligase n=1 Tax=Clonorchis sinensis TaxID=79923 RepID=G7YG37_CLOSI|nr:glutamate--cysteine ligase catalytic subunit [Clonorchis sinensis]
MLWSIVSTLYHIPSLKVRLFFSPSRFIWSPEYAEYQIEGLPAIPFGQLLYAFSTVQPNMRKRRQQLMEFLPENAFALTLTVFPR